MTATAHSKPPVVNLTATTDPGTSNDNTEGYVIGSRWINVTLDKEFIAMDVATAAAVWKPVVAVDYWELKTADEGTLEVFSGTPDVESTNWDSGDFTAYRKVVGTGASQLGGLVYEFVIPTNVSSLLEVAATGKVGSVAAGNQINVRVKREDATQIDTGGPYTITAATKTTVSITSFSGATIVAGTRFVVEMEAQVDNTEEVFIGSCRIKMAR